MTRSCTRGCAGRPRRPARRLSRRTARRVFFGASYHADYATILCAAGGHARGRPRGRRRARRGCGPRRPAPRPLGCRRPAATPLRRPGRRRARVGVRGSIGCGRVDGGPRARGGLPDPGPRARRRTSRASSAPWARRSATRSAARSVARRTPASSPSTRRRTRSADLDAFVDLHQKRWGAEGLFPDPRRAARRAGAFFRGLSSTAAADGLIALHFLTVGRPPDRGRHLVRRRRDRSTSTTPAWTRRRATCRPAWLWSPSTIEMALAAGKSGFDFLRGDEPYKYGWGARDVPIQRLLVMRMGVAMTAPAPGDTVPSSRRAVCSSPAAPACASSRFWRPARTAARRSTSTRSSPGSIGRATTRASSRSRPGPPSAGSRPRRSRSTSSTSPMTRSRSDALAHLACRRRRRGRPQPHVPRRAGRDTRRRSRSARPGTRRPYLICDRPLEPDPQRGGPRRAAPPHATDGPPRRGRRAIVRKIADERRAEPRSRSSTTAWTCDGTSAPRRAARSPRSTACSPAPRSWASSAAWSRRRATAP